jgi:hypothetical protein
MLLPLLLPLLRAVVVRRAKTPALAYGAGLAADDVKLQSTNESPSPPG